MPQQHELKWTGLDPATTEHCLVTIGESDIRVRATIMGADDAAALSLRYEIILNLDWETQRVAIQGHIGTHTVNHEFVRFGATWTGTDGRQLTGAHPLEPDISLTPLTNTLPLRRLGLALGEAAEIEVLYFDLEAGTVDIRRQRYTRLAGNDYRFETIPAGFEAAISVDENGFVSAYPGLFERL